MFRAATANDATGAEEFVAIKVVSIAGKGSLRAARSVRLGPSPECIPTRPQSRWEWVFPLTFGAPADLMGEEKTAETNLRNLGKEIWVRGEHAASTRRGSRKGHGFSRSVLRQCPALLHRCRAEPRFVMARIGEIGG